MRRILLLTCLLLLWAATARAEDAEFNSTPGFVLTPSSEQPDTLRLGTEFHVVGNAGFTNGQGSVRVVRTALRADYSLFSLTWGVSHFDWRDKAAVTFSSAEGRAPWDDLYDVALQARLVNGVWADKWHYWVNGELSASFERDFPGAMGAGFDGGVAYDFWDGWMFGLSAKTIALSALRTDLFGEVKLGMVVAVSQKTLRRTLRAAGLLPEMPNGSESIGFSFYLTGAEKTYRLSPHSPVRSNGYLGLRYSAVGAALEYAPDKRWSLFIGPEYNYARKYILYDSSGGLTSSHDLKNAWGGRVGFQYTF